MPQVAIDDTYRVVATLVRGSEQIVNVFHVEDAATPLTQSQQEGVCNAVAALYTGPIPPAPAPTRGIRPYIDASVSLFSVTCQRIEAVPYDDPVEVLYGTAGTAAGDALPGSTALCVSFRTGLASRNARGRVFLGGFSEAANDESSDGYPRPNTTFLEHVRLAIADMQDRLQLVNGTLDLVVASYATATSRPVTSARTNNVWSAQRRRENRIPITSTIAIPIA